MKAAHKENSLQNFANIIQQIVPFTVEQTLYATIMEIVTFLMLIFLYISDHDRILLGTEEGLHVVELLSDSKFETDKPTLYNNTSTC